MKGLEDILAEGLSVVFCGINPGLLASATGHHFAGRGNRFWRTLHLAGFTPEELNPDSDRSILKYRFGLTTVVERPTARADELLTQEFAAAATRFEQKIARYAPTYVAFLGKAAYAGLSGQKLIHWGLQTQTFGGSAVWVLPNPSGRNLSFTLAQLVSAYSVLFQHSLAIPRVPESTSSTPFSTM